MDYSVLDYSFLYYKLSHVISEVHLFVRRLSIRYSGPNSFLFHTKKVLAPFVILISQFVHLIESDQEDKYLIIPDEREMCQLQNEAS